MTTREALNSAIMEHLGLAALTGGKMSVLEAFELGWQAATLAAKRQPLDLSDYRIKHGWEQTFSTDNPFCPCNLKSFTKAVNWAVADLNFANGLKA